MKIQTLERDVETNLTASRAFKVANNAKMFNILSDKIYSDKPRAIVREIFCNAYDIHKQIGQTRPILFSLPNRVDPSLSIRDFGTGLSADEVLDHYTTYFDSSKGKDNDLIGGFGLGCKSPFAYTDAFTVTTFQNGTKTVYAAYKGPDGIPQISLAAQVDTDEDDGLEVKVPIKDGDRHLFETAAQEVLKWFPEDSYQALGTTITPVAKSLVEDRWFILERAGLRNIVLMGNVAYEVDWSMIDKNLPRNIVPIFNIGELDLPPSREQLSYNPMTLDNLREAYETIAKQLPVSSLEQAETLTPLQRLELVQTLRDSNLQGVFDEYHKLMGHRQEDDDAFKLLSDEAERKAFRPKWGKFLKWEHENLVVEGSYREYSPYSSYRYRSSHLFDPKFDSGKDLIFTNANRLRNSVFIHNDVAGHTPRIYDRLENSGLKDVRAYIFKDKPVGVEFQSLSDFAPTEKAKRTTVRLRTWVSPPGSQWFHDEEASDGIWIPYKGSYPNSMLWSQLQYTKLIKDLKIVGLNVTNQKKVLNGEGWIKLEDYLLDRIEELRTDPDFQNALNARHYLDQAEEDHSKLISLITRHRDLLPDMFALITRMQAEAEKYPTADYNKALVALGKDPIKVGKDTYRLSTQLERIKKRNPVLTLFSDVLSVHLTLSNDQLSVLKGIVK